jgi:hypothetical protein
MRVQATVVAISTVSIIFNLNTSLIYGVVTAGNRLLCASLPRFAEVTRHLDNADVIVHAVIPLTVCIVCLLCVAVWSFGKFRQRRRTRESSANFGGQSETAANVDDGSREILRANENRAPARRVGEQRLIQGQGQGRSNNNHVTVRSSNNADDNNFVVHFSQPANQRRFYFGFVLAFVACNAPLCIIRSIVLLQPLLENAFSSAEAAAVAAEEVKVETDLGYFLREQVAEFFQYVKLAINLPLLMTNGAFCKSARMSTIVVARTLARFRRIRMRDDDTWEGDDEDDDEERDAHNGLGGEDGGGAAATTAEPEVTSSSPVHRHIAHTHSHSHANHVHAHYHHGNACREQPVVHHVHGQICHSLVEHAV